MVETQKQVEGLKKTYLSWSLHDSDVRREGIQQGRKEGIAIGEEHAKLEAARNMLAKNKLTLKEIAEYTGLPIETIQEQHDTMLSAGTVSC